MGDRLGVRGRLFMAFFGISAFAVLAAAAAMHSFLEVGKALEKITQHRVPSALSSLEISRQVERIVAAAPALLTVGTPTQREQLAARIAAEIDQLDGLLSGLQGSSSDAAVLELIERDAAQLRSNLDALDALVARRLEAGEHKSDLLNRLSGTHNAAQRLITPGLMVVEGDLSQLRKILGDPDLSAEARVSTLSGLVDSIAASPPLQRAQIATLSINDALLRIASAPRPAEVELLAFPVQRALGVLENLAAGISPMLRARLLGRAKEYRALVDGPDSILQARQHELAIVADSERLLDENAALSGELTETVNLLVAGAKSDIENANLDALSVQRLSTGILVAVVALSLISSTLIVWLYVGRNLIARLTTMSSSMLAIAGGNLETTIPAGGSDEIGAMAKALAVFRDTAIEVKETNLREIREARRRLVDAIESISEGFSLYDSKDRLVISNTRYRELLYPDAEDAIEQGTPFETIIRRAAEKGYIEGAKGRIDEWVSERQARHRDPGEPQLQQRSDGRWIQVNERKTEDGGTVAVYTDITELKRAEQAATEAEARLTDAIENISEGFVLYDPDGHLVLCNSRFKEIYGYSDAEVSLGVSFEDLVRLDIEKGTVAEDGDDGSGHFEKHVEERHRAEDSFDLRLSDGRWLNIRDRKTTAGGYVSTQSDVTELRCAENALREHEQLLETILNHMPALVYLRDAEGRFKLVNRKYEEVHDLDNEQIQGKTLHEVFPKERADEFASLDAEVLKRHQIQECEERHWLGEEERIHAVVKFPTFDIGGDVVGVGGVDIDITDRKRTEKALSEKTEFLQLTEVITRAANEATSIEDAMQMALDQVCRHTSWPVGHAYMLDESAGELVPSGLWHLDDAEAFETFRKVTEAIRFEPGVGLPGRVLASGEPAWIFDVTKDPNFPRAKLATEIGVKGGFAFPVLVGPRVVAVLEFFAAEAVEAYKPLLEVMAQIGTQLGRVIERTRAEEAVRESELRFRQMLRGSPIAVAISIDDGSEDDGKILFSNDRLAELLGGTTEELLEARSSAFLPEGEVRTDLERMVQQGAIIRDREATLRRLDGSDFWSLLSVSSMDYKSKKSALWWIYDITERKRAEQALLEAKRRSEEASKLVVEKNRMLESLSNQLSKYLSPQVYASIFSGEQSVEIASKRKKLTVFFSDIADFTETTDNLESEELTNLLNHYLTEMSKVALNHGATLDKYVGDAIIAFFGDPESRGAKADAIACVEMAIAMQRRMRELQSEWLDMGLEKPFQVRMGINTGFCTVGNFGSGDRMDYTIIGNEVNLAARLEAHAEVGGILLAHETHALVKDRVLAEEGETLTVKGFAKPVRTYAVAGLYDDLAEQGRIIRTEQEGLQILLDLKKQDKATAIATIEAFLSELRDGSAPEA